MSQQYRNTQRRTDGNWRKSNQNNGNDWNGQNQVYSQRRQHTRQYNDNTTWERRENYNRNINRQDVGLVIHVESSKVGKLIGKGGCKIKELQEKSKARINIDRNSSGDTTAVTLIGSEEVQQNAKQLIDDLLNEDANIIQFTEPQKINTPSPEEKEDDIYFANFDWTKALEENRRMQAERWAKYPAIVKNFYKEDPDIANLSKERVAEMRLKNNNIEVKLVFEDKDGGTQDDYIPNPVETFEQAFSSYPDILKEIKKQGFENPSPIQRQGWPILMSGRDMIGIAQTGTGKTLAFLLPALIHIDGQTTPRDERPGPNVLVMAPTRELALQIEKEVAKYSYHGIKAACVYGGGSRKDQINIVTKGVQIVIATPGRLNDLVQAKVLNVTGVTYLVLDEADRMLDMGFEPQIRKTLIDVRPDRQTVMTSATWPQGVRRLAQSYMRNPIQVFVGSLDLAAVHTVTQKIYFVDEEEKLEMMYTFFREMGPDDKVMVFFGKKARVDDISSELALMGVPCQSIHGGRDQCDREQALEDLKVGEVRILLATDVASRGIDIEDVTHVLNYDFPRDIEEYVHRVGRTGRAGRTGESITLMTRKDWSHAKELIKILQEANQEVPDELYRMAERYEAWKDKKSREKERERMDARGGGRNRYGGRRDYGWS